MTKSARAPETRADKAAADLDVVQRVAAAVDTIENRMRASRRGEPGSGFGSGGSSGGASSSVERSLGLNAPGDTYTLPRDQGAEGLAALDAWLKASKRLADDGLRLLAWAPHEPDAKAKALAEKDNTAEPECERCRSMLGLNEDRLCFTDFDGVWSEPMPEKLGLCRWEYDFGRREGRLPTHAELNRHHRGRMDRA